MLPGVIVFGISSEDDLYEAHFVLRIIEQLHQNPPVIPHLTQQDTRRMKEEEEEEEEVNGEQKY